MIVQKAFKYRFFPTAEQAAQLAKTFGCARYVYNQALEFRTTAWQQEKKSISYHTTAAKLTEWKKEPEKAFLSEVSSVVLQQSLRNLDTAFTNFFEKRSQYPKFKSRCDRQGEGSVGQVYLALDLRLGRKVALKFLRQEFTRDPRLVQRFMREAQAASGISHPNIVTGAKPFTGENPASVSDAIVYYAPAPLRRERPETPSALERVINRALEKDCASRYQTAAEIRDELQQLCNLFRNIA